MSSPRLSKKNVSLIVDALSEIEYHFDQIGMVEREVTDAPIETKPDLPAEAEDSEGEYLDQDFTEEEDEYYSDRIFQKEEVEIAVDAFLTALFNKKLIKKDRRGGLPSFGESLRRLFGDDDEVVSIADSFEEHIKGYFDCISSEDMSAAYDEFVKIRDIIRRKIA
jgi:hypothetical protein